MTKPERLEKLADMLAGEPSSWPKDDGQSVNFDMHCWYQRRPECGTACCAAGLAALDPAFQAEGLGLCYDDDGPRATMVIAYTDPATGETAIEKEALRRFFGNATPFFAVNYLEYPPTPASVAARLRLVADRLREQESAADGRTG